MAVDSFGLEITTASAGCAAAVAEYCDAVLAYRPFGRWQEAAERAAAEDPGCPLARVLRADLQFCRGDAAAARRTLEGLRADISDQAAPPWTWRERQYVLAWGCWVLDADPAGCYDALQAVIDRHPSDLFAVKRAQVMGLVLGDGARILSAVEAAGQQWSPGAGLPPRYLHGMWAFGLEQEGRYEDAEEKAREGLTFEAELGRDAWLDHGLAHSLYFQGEELQDDALEFLQGRCQSWSKEELHPFLYTHNWWHLALALCEARRMKEALAIFDERLWADDDVGLQVDPQVQLNALNLLWRLETRGLAEDCLPRWRKVLVACRGITLPASQAAGEGDSAPHRGSCQHGDLLLDVLLARGMCAASEAPPAGDGAGPLQEWLAAVSAHAGTLGADTSEAYAECARCVAELYRRDLVPAGLPAREAAAKNGLRAVRDRWAKLGGSLEQRGVLLEAVEGPVVSGAPEKNYDNLFL